MFMCAIKANKVSLSIAWTLTQSVLDKDDMN